MPLSRSRVLLAALIGCVFIASAGCIGLGHRGEDGALGIPPEGRVRIVATRVKQDADTVHWKWSVIGERNWTVAAAKGTDLSLSNTYLLNDATHRGGCNVYEVDLEATRSGQTGAGRWNLRLHGSNGDTATSEGTLPAGGTKDAVTIVQDADAVMRLPATLQLATVDGHPVTFTIAR